MSGLGPDDSGFESRHSDQMKIPLYGVFSFGRMNKPTAWLMSGIRKPQAYFASKRNAEEWPASPENDGSKELVGEIPGTPYSL
jgi:hypothetical protein